MKIRLPEQIVESVQRDVLLYENYLRRIAYEVLHKEISKYPIFIAHREGNLSLGKLVIDRDKEMTEWAINASLLEEFVAKGLIARQRMPDFREVYKNPLEYACIFIVSGDSDAGFAFYKYRQDDNNLPTEEESSA